MEREKELKDLVAGDLVVVRNTFNEDVEEVSRVTKTMILIKGRTFRFRRTTGSEIGYDGYHSSRITPASSEDIKRIADRKRKKRLVYK